MSLRQRLLVCLSLVLGFSILIGAVLLYVRATDKVRVELHAALVVGEQVLIDAVKEIERAPNPIQQMRIVIERFSGGRHLRITLLDAKGARIASSHIAEPDHPAPEWFNAAMGGAGETARVALPSNVRGYSALLIEADPRNEVQESWEDLGFALSVLAILCALAAALIYGTVGLELKPLDDLKRALSQVAEGDFGVRLAEGRSSDFKNVNTGFNDMVSRLAQTEQANTRLQEQLANVQEDERTELARDLHDEIGPLLFSVGLDAAAVQKALGETAHREAVERLTAIRDSVSLSQKHVLEILSRLRSGTVEDVGLETAVNQLIEFWRSRQPALKITSDISEQGLGAHLDPIVYRVIQESLSNAVRHGQPSRIDVSAVGGGDGIVRVTVCDNGGGLKSDRWGHGLTGMRERVTSHNGMMSVRNRGDGKGVLVTADFRPATNLAAQASNLEYESATT